MLPQEKKIRVDIIRSGLPPLKKMCEVRGKYVIIQKRNATKRIPEYKASFTNQCLIPYKKGLLSKDFKLMVKEGAGRCINFYPKTRVYETDKTEIERLFRANVLEKAGVVSHKVEIPMLFWLVMVALFVIGLLNLLATSGTVRFG